MTEPGPTVAPPLDPDLIDQAVGEKLVRWCFTPVVGREFTRYHVLHTGRAMNYLALMVHRDPAARTSDERPVIDRLLEQIRFMIAGGNEPLCRGTIAGWADNSAAQTLALAKHTRAVWQRLTAEEKDRCTWLMKALTVAGNYCQNHDADVRRCLFQNYNWRKHWNPNHQEGYVGAMIAAWFYFGGAREVNRVLASFDYDDWTAKLANLGLTNITGCWQATGKERMEDGGADDAGGKIVSIRTPFTYKDVWGDGGRAAYEPFALFEVLARRMYAHLCRDRVFDKASVAGPPSPWVGRLGMALEFDSNDMQGMRSDAQYAYDGWSNSVLTCATMLALDGFGKGPRRDRIAERMVVGSEDLIHKLKVGYHGWANGKKKYADESTVAERGYLYVKDIWRKLIAPAFRRETTAPRTPQG